jgi:glycosyltransferase involved in cell wall biosynthesis
MSEKTDARTGNIHFIAWHIQTRSRNLAARLGIPLHELEIHGNVLWRNVISSLWTLWLIIRKRPRVIITQCSFVLLVILASYKLLWKNQIRVIADCHTKALRRRAPKYLDLIFWPIKKWSFRQVDAIIVSSKTLSMEASILNERVLVLADPIPDFDRDMIGNKENGDYCVFISSFADDEPVAEVIEAAAMLKSQIPLYWTGRVPKAFHRLIPSAENIRFTSYLADGEYQKLILNATCLLVLTCEENCLMSGAYEGLAAEVPMVLSDRNALRRFFGLSAIYCDHLPESIADAVGKAWRNGDKLRAYSRNVKFQREQEFAVDLEKLRRFLYKEPENMLQTGRQFMPSRSTPMA